MCTRKLRIRSKAGALVAMAAMLATTAGIAVTAAPAGAVTTTTVVVGNGDFAPNGPWAVPNTTGTYAFVNGPATPPAGVGSLEMTIGGHEWVNNYSYGACSTGLPACSNPPANWTPLSTIDALGFSVYRASGTTYPSLNLEADWTGTGSSYTTFVFIPDVSLIAASPTWQAWNGLSPTDGTWYSTTNIGIAPFNCAFQAAGCNASWAQIQAAYPAAKVKYGIGPNVGTGGTFAGNIDNMNVGVSTATTVYNFEPDCTTVCYVSTSGNDFNTGESGDPLATVQAGINRVSSGGTVNVAAGTYTEQLVVNKPVTITGAGEASTKIEGPASMVDSSCVGGGARAEVDVCGSANSTVTMSQLTVSGGATGEDADGVNCAPEITGILVSDGETLNISNSTVTNVYNAAGSSAWGCQQGIAVEAGWDSQGEVGHLIADHLTVLRYQKGGIVIDGQASSATITHALVQGDQLPGLSAAIAMNGIEIANGADASVSTSTISGNKCDLVTVCGPDPLADTQSAGILSWDIPGQSPVASVSFTNNTVTNNDVGLWPDQVTQAATISGNAVNANRYVGMLLDEGIASVTNNQIKNNTGTGAYAVQGFWSVADSTANLTGNTISGNGTGIKASDVAADAFTTHVSAIRNAITSNPTKAVNNTAASTLTATCDWWGQSSGPVPGSVSGTVTTSPFLGSSNLAGPCPAPTVPGTPAPAFAVPYNDHGAKVVWRAPASNGGSAITGYRITPYAGNVAQPAQVFAGTATSKLITGLSDGASYRFTVAARNAVGFGPASAKSPAMIAGAPGQPGKPTVVKPAPGSLKVTFAKPMNNGAAITTLTATCASSNGGVTKTKTGTASPITVTALTPNKSYTCRVSATNSRGAGPLSDPSAAINA